MSRVAIRAALETALNAMSPALATAWENRPYTPEAGTPYQRVNVLFARPVNSEISRAFEQDGFMQVTLLYPPDAGPGDAAARADLLTTTFYRGRSLTSGGVTVTILYTPETLPGFRDGDRYAVPVRVPFHAEISAA